MGPAKKQAGHFGERGSMYRRGDVLRIQVAFDVAKPPHSLWLSVERCDDRHGIVSGTITGTPIGFGKALSYGAKLGVAYHLVQENTSIVGHAASQRCGS